MHFFLSWKANGTGAEVLTLTSFLLSATGTSRDPPVASLKELATTSLTGWNKYHARLKKSFRVRILRVLRANMQMLTKSKGKISREYLFQRVVKS